MGDLPPFRSIGDMAAELGVRPHVLRYWEEQFPMLQPLKRAGGRRHYRPEDVALLHRIHRLVNGEGYTLRGARGAIEAERARAPAASLLAAHGTARVRDEGDARLVAGLRALRDRLARALAEG